MNMLHQQIGNVINMEGTNNTDGLNAINSIGKLNQKMDLVKPAVMDLIKENPDVLNFTLPGFKGIELDSYQREAIIYMCYEPRCILADEGGLGKTIMGLGLAMMLKKMGEGYKTLVICPASASYDVWQRDIETKTDLKLFNISSLDISERTALYNGQIGTGAEVYIVNYELFRRDYDVVKRCVGGKCYKRLMDYMGSVFRCDRCGRLEPVKNPMVAIAKRFYDNFNLLILDESSYVKNFFTDTSICIRELAKEKHIPRVIMLNATPVENSPLDIYSQVNTLYPGSLGKLRNFEDNYLIRESKSIYVKGKKRLVNKFVGSKNLDDLRSRIQNLILRRVPEEVGIEYPDVVWEECKVNFLPEQREKYTDMIHHVRKTVSRLKANDIKTHFIHLLMCCDFPSLVDKIPVIEGESCKEFKLKEILDKEKGNKIVIFSRFKSVIMVLEELLSKWGMNTVKIVGDVTKQERSNNIDSLRNDIDINVLLLDLAGCRSINLDMASVFIFFDLYTNPAVDKQLILRLCRRTQKNTKVKVYNILVEKSIEERVVNLVTERMSMFEELFGDTGVGLSVSDMKKLILETGETDNTKVEEKVDYSNYSLR